MRKISLAISLWLLPVAADAAPCITWVYNTNMQISNSTLEACIRGIIGAGNTQGTWGGHLIEIDYDNVAYVDGQVFGRARSAQEEGTASPYDRWSGQGQQNWNYYRNVQPK